MKIRMNEGCGSTKKTKKPSRPKKMQESSLSENLTSELLSNLILRTDFDDVYNDYGYYGDEDFDNEDEWFSNFKKFLSDNGFYGYTCTEDLLIDKISEYFSIDSSEAIKKLNEFYSSMNTVKEAGGDYGYLIKADENDVAVFNEYGSENVWAV